MKRFTTRIRSSGLFQRIATMALLAGVLITFVSCQDKWPISTWKNETDVPVYVTVNNNGTTILRPQEKESFPGGFALKGEPGPDSYTIRAYEFLPGKGDIPGWRETAGEPPVYGGQGDLLFSVTYTREEIEAMNYTVTITQNVSPGQSPPGSLP